MKMRGREGVSFLLRRLRVESESKLTGSSSSGIDGLPSERVQLGS